MRSKYNYWLMLRWDLFFSLFYNCSSCCSINGHLQQLGVGNSRLCLQSFVRFCSNVPFKIYGIGHKDSDSTQAMGDLKQLDRSTFFNIYLQIEITFTFPFLKTNFEKISRISSQMELCLRRGELKSQQYKKLFCENCDEWKCDKCSSM